MIHVHVSKLLLLWIILKVCLKPICYAFEAYLEWTEEPNNLQKSVCCAFNLFWYFLENNGEHLVLLTVKFYCMDLWISILVCSFASI